MLVERQRAQFLPLDLFDGFPAVPQIETNLVRVHGHDYSMADMRQYLIIPPMIRLTIPGRGELVIQHIVTDVNGTLALDGVLFEGLAERIAALRGRAQIHLLTADTHGRQAFIDEQLGLTAVRIQGGNEAEQKADYVRRLGAETVAAIGQGANDAAMLKEAALGICVMSREGVAIETLLSADLLTPDIFAALELFDHPSRIVASLRR